MHLETNRPVHNPMQHVINLIPTRYLDSPTTAITDILSVSFVYLGFNYAVKQISHRATHILQHQVTQFAQKAFAVISLAGGVYIIAKAYNDETPVRNPRRIEGQYQNTPGISPYDRFL